MERVYAVRGSLDVRASNTIKEGKDNDKELSPKQSSAFENGNDRKRFEKCELFKRSRPACSYEFSSFPFYNWSFIAAGHGMK